MCLKNNIMIIVIMRTKCGYIKLSFSVKDYMGSYCANGGKTLEDVCDKCCVELNDLIIDKIKEIKGRSKEDTK